jgi:hypothetical protein
LITIFSAILFVPSCFSADAGPVGTYEAQVTFAPTPEPNVREITLTASLTLNENGSYIFECTEQQDFYPCYVEEGNYTINGDEIALAPSACQAYAEAKWDMKVLNADEQASMTTNGTLSKDTFTATMRWYDRDWEFTTDMQLKRIVRPNTPTASAAHDAAKGAYTGEFSLELKFGGTDGRPVWKSTFDIDAKLILDKSGTYIFACGHARNTESRGMTYREVGTYTLSGDEIIFIPSEAMFKGKGGAGVMQTLTADEQASMTTKATLKDNTVTAKMRWLYNYHTVTSEMQLVRGDTK